MGWLRQLPQAPAARNILTLIERLRFVRELGIDADRQRSVSVAGFERLATDCLRTTVQHVRELAVPRRRAMLVAAVIRLESALNDATLFIFEKLLGTMSRKAERRTAEKSFQTLREVQVHLRTLTAACRAVVEARESTADPVAAVEQQVGWEKFVQSVVEAESLAQPEVTDTRRELIAKYPTIRCFAAAFLEAFEFRGGGAVSNLLKALALISEMYRNGKRTLPLKPPTAFIRRAWRPFVFKDGDIDRRALRIVRLLRTAQPASGRRCVDRSESTVSGFCIPKLTFEMLKAERPLPVEIETEVQRYLESRRSALMQELATVATLAESGKLPDVDLAEGDLKITPLRAVTPPEAESLRDAAYDLLPRIKITDLLLEVDRWTGFSECFTHQRNGQPAENKAALLTTILADGINLGLSRMAEASRGATLRQLAWVHDWHIREETYAAALSRLINARHGNEPGVTFHTRLSDQFGPYYTKVIAATASEAPHVLDGLLYHQTGLQIEEHYTDTGGATDHVFGLCHLFGFRFAPPMRDLKDRRLYFFPGQKPHPMLDPLVGGFADVHHITTHWNDILRLATSIRSGTVTASAILQKLSAYPRQNGLAVALREIGRIERTLFTLDWLKNIDLRRRANAGLNKGEARNALARAIFFYRLGEMRDRSFESQVYRASGLNLLIAAIILWNTRYLEQTFVELERQGVDVSPTIVAHVAPLGWEHVGLTGDYVWSDGQRPSNGSLRRSGGENPCLQPKCPILLI